MASVDETESFWTLERLRKHWVLGLVCVTLCMVVGVAVGAAKPQTYTAESRLAVGTGSMSDLNIPGFPTASSAIAANYARWVDATGIPGLELPDGTDSVRASPFPQSNVIRLEAMSRDKDIALKAASQVAKRLISEVNAVKERNDTQALLDEVTDLSGKSAAAQQERDRRRTNLNTVQAQGGGANTVALQEAQRRFTEADAAHVRAELKLNALQDRYRRLVSSESTEADLSIVGEGANISGSDRWANVQRFALGGVGVGVLLTLLGIRWVEATRRRRG